MTITNKKEFLETETAEQRWLRWDKLLNQKKYVEVVSEFDLFFKNKEQFLVGDIARREQALEALGIISFSKQKYIYQSKNKKNKL